MNGRGEKGMVAVALALLLVVSAMSLVAIMVEEKDDGTTTPTASTIYETNAYDRIIASNFEPEDLESEMDEDGDGDPEIDNGTLDEAGTVDPEALLDTDGDDSPEYSEIGGEDTPLGYAANGSNSTGMVDFDHEVVEDNIGLDVEADNGTLEGEIEPDEDTVEVTEYDPEEEADVADEAVVEPDDVDEYGILDDQVSEAQALADPDTEELDSTDNDTDGNDDWSRNLYWTHDTVDADGDGFPEYEFALLLIITSYDNDSDGNPEFTSTFIAGYMGYDNNSNNKSEYEAVLVIRIATYDANDDGVPGLIHERNWGVMTYDGDEDGRKERRLSFVAYRTVLGETDHLVTVRKWAHRMNDLDDDGVLELDSAIYVQKIMRFDGQDMKSSIKRVWMRQTINNDDDVWPEENRVVVIFTRWYDNNTDGNPEFYRGSLGGYEVIRGDNISRSLLVMTTVGIDIDSDGNQEYNATLVWWHRQDSAQPQNIFDILTNRVIYGMIGVIWTETRDNSSDGTPEFSSIRAGVIEMWDADHDGMEEVNRTAAAGEDVWDADGDGNAEKVERFAWFYEAEYDNDDTPNHVTALVLRENIYDNDSSGHPDYHFFGAAGYEAWDNNTNDVPDYEALFVVRNQTWANNTEIGADGYHYVQFALKVTDADEDENIERGAFYANEDIGIDQNSDGHIDSARGTWVAHRQYDTDDDGTPNFMGNYFGAYNFNIVATEEYEESSESEESHDEIDSLLDNDGDGEPDQDQGTITEFVEDELQNEIEELMDGDGDETPDFSEIENEPIEELSTGGDNLTSFEPLDVEDVNDALANETEGEPSDDIYSEDKKAEHGMDENLTHLEQPPVDHEQDILIAELDLDQKILWWEGDMAGGAPELEVGMIAQGHELYDNNSDGQFETQIWYQYQLQMEGVQGDGVARHRQASLARAIQYDNDTDGHYETTMGEHGYIETWNNDTTGGDEYVAAIWIGIYQQDADGDGAPEVNRTVIAGVEARYRTEDHENPYHMRAVIGFMQANDSDSDGNPEYAFARAGALEAWDNDTDGNPDSLACYIFGIEYVDSNSDGNPEVNRTYIWILELADKDSDENPERVRAAIIVIESFDNDTDGTVDEGNAMSAGCLKLDQDDDGTKEKVIIYVAGGKEVEDGTEWFLWFHEYIDEDDDGEGDVITSYALYMRNMTDGQTIVNAVHIQDGDTETIYFGMGHTVDSNEDGISEEEDSGTFFVKSDSSTGECRGALTHTKKQDTNSDGNPEYQSTLVIGYETEDDDLDGVPERSTILMIHTQMWDNNSNGNSELAKTGAVGAYVEGNDTQVHYGYLYLIYAEAHDTDDNGTEDNSTIYLAGYEFYNNDTDDDKEYEAVLVQPIIWNDDNGNGKHDDGETHYDGRFGAEVHRD